MSYPGSEVEDMTEDTRTRAIAGLKRVLAGVVLDLILTGGAAAGPFENGLAAYQRHDYATALRLWRPRRAGLSPSPV